MMNIVSRFIYWTTQLNETDHVSFAIVTVVTMIATGAGIALLAELLFVLFGMKTKK